MLVKPPVIVIGVGCSIGFNRILIMYYVLSKCTSWRRTWWWYNGDDGGCAFFSVECMELFIISLSSFVKPSTITVIDSRLSLLNKWNHAVGAGRTARTFVLLLLLCAWLWSCYWLVFGDAVYVGHNNSNFICCTKCFDYYYVTSSVLISDGTISLDLDLDAW